MGVIDFCISCGGDGVVPEAKLADPHMITADNPLASGYEKPDPLYALKRANRRRLVKDAEMRACPVRGRAYSAIMDTRYKGE